MIAALLFAFIGMLTFGGCTMPQIPQNGKSVKPSSGAGSWFPAASGALSDEVDRYLSSDTPDLPEHPVALIVPHAGYTYSGPVAGTAFATLRDSGTRRVILLGLSHRESLKGASVLRVDAYETPIGQIPVDPEARDALLGCSVVKEQETAHQGEHSVENQLPFLQRVLDDFSMVEVLVGELSARERDKLASVLRDLMDGETVIVVSTDFTHYGPNFMYVPFGEPVSTNLQALNDMALQEIFQIDQPGWEEYLAKTGDTICGRNAVGLLLAVLQPWDDARGLRIAYDTSGRMTGDWSNSVTYASIAFWREGTGLTEDEQQTLLRIARDTATTYLTDGTELEIDKSRYELSPRLLAPGAAFVTLRNKELLRGCIGHVVAMTPLYKSVAHNAIQACRDPRFTSIPVTVDELPELTVEVSVLTPMRRLLDTRKIEVGRDGLMMVQGQMSGLLLPQVPVEQRWDREEFLAQTCNKAGLPPDAWKNQNTEIYRFAAQVFSEDGNHR